jgi:hypothetical protein
VPQIPTDPNVMTVHLGQFTWETANAIAAELERAGITWWYKQPGWLSSLWEPGIRLFVDRDRLEESKQIAQMVVDQREAD